MNAELATLTKVTKPFVVREQLSADGKGVEKYYGGFYDELKRLNPGEIE
jgi:hypothetical protein